MKTLSSLVVLISAFLLQGCVAAAIISAAAVGTKAVNDPRTIGTQIDDNTLEIRINRALLKDKQIKKYAHINAVTYQNKVLLVGQAPNHNLMMRAKQIVTEIGGAVEIFNEVRQNQPINLINTSYDTWITAKVRAHLLSSRQVKSLNIKVTTENREVFLLGLVTKQEGKMAAYIASLVDGVKNVTTAFIYVR